MPRQDARDALQASSGDTARLEQLLRGSRVLWQSGKPVWSTDLPRTGRSAVHAVPKSGGHFATFALPVPSPQGTIALLAFSGQTTREPDASFLDAVPAMKWGVLVNPLGYVSEGLSAALTPSLPHMPTWAFLLALGALGGCGSQTVHELPPAAGPPRSPVPRYRNGSPART